MESRGVARISVAQRIACSHSQGLTGNINCLRVLKNTLEEVKISYCPNVEGDFMDLADYLNLVELDMYHTSI